jgi:hypothetical protein
MMSLKEGCPLASEARFPSQLAPKGPGMPTQGYLRWQICHQANALARSDAPSSWGSVSEDIKGHEPLEYSSLLYDLRQWYECLIEMQANNFIRSWTILIFCKNKKAKGLSFETLI